MAEKKIPGLGEACAVCRQAIAFTPEDTALSIFRFIIRFADEIAAKDEAFFMSYDEASDVASAQNPEGVRRLLRTLREQWPALDKSTQTFFWRRFRACLKACLRHYRATYAS